MSIQELMRPRYIIVADYPGSKVSVGDIYAPSDSSEIESFWNKYPDLFRKLEWWEERKPEDMPKYVKLKDGSRVAKAIFDLEETNEYFMFLDNEIHPYAPGIVFVPATEEEYLASLNTSKK